MKKITQIFSFITLSLFLQLILQQTAVAQTPQYFYKDTMNGGNMSTFNSTYHKTSQFLYYPKDFNKTLVPGSMTNVYVWVGGGQSSVTYTNFSVKLGMTTLNSLPGGPWTTTGMVEVLASKSYTISNIKSNNWLKIPLQIPFNYDGSSNFIFEVSHTDTALQGFTTSFYAPTVRSTVSRMKYGPTNGPYYAEYFPPIFFGFDLCNAIPIDLGKDTCINESLLLDAGSSKGSKYLWNDGSTSSTLNAAAAGTYFVTVTSDSGCIASDTIQLFKPTVNRISDTACNSYTFNKEIYTTSGIYTQTFPIKNAACDSVVELNLVINDFNLPVINVNIFKLSTTTPYDTYQWMLDGNTIPNAIQSTYTVTKNGNYQVIVSNSDGCGDTSKMYEITNVDGTNIHNLGNSSTTFKVYPNPAINSIHIENKRAIEMKKIMLVNLLGQVIYSETQIPVTTNYQINTSGISSGIYFLKIETNTTSIVEKVEIKK